jgi:aspartate/methionine/tyrosine aminotransferase
MTHSNPAFSEPERRLDLRTGSPYASLINNHKHFAAVVGDYFGINADDVVPTFGSTGAIEAIRNHIFRLVLKPHPVLLTVSPGYWRVRESFQGFGFKIAAIETISNGFNINEAALIQKATELQPEVVYLSLPNNPTGAVFDGAAVVAGIPERTAVILDFTLPGRRLDTRELATHIYRRFQGRSKLFLIGSTAKSHSTAEYRIGWAICARSEDAALLNKENRNLISSIAVEKAVARLYQEPPVHAFIEKSFHLLKGAAGETFELIEPAKRVESSYVLVRLCGDPAAVRSSLDQHRIAVMWGSEFGLTDKFVRLEVSEPENVREFIAALAPALEKKQSA